ncbi:MAG: hypothetical protein ACE5RH_04525 [Nitrosarchaeum sp.]
MKNKKQKGNKFEIKTCRRFSKWFSNGERDDLFWHTSGSGATATNQMRNKSFAMANSCGDMCYLDAIGKPLCELALFEFKSGYTEKIKKDKNGKLKKTTGKKISITDLLDSKNRKNEPLLIEWIRKAQNESKKHNRKHSIIVFARDRRSGCIVFHQNTWDMLSENNGRHFIHPHDGVICFINYKDLNLVVLKLNDFFAWCHPKAFFEKINRIPRRKYKTGKYSGKNIKKLKGDL